MRKIGDIEDTLVAGSATTERKPSDLTPTPVPRKRKHDKRVPMPTQDLERRTLNFSEINFGFNEKQALAEASRCLNCPSPQCRTGCPINNNIPEFIYRITQRDYHGAYEIIKERNSAPSITCRVCPQEVQCEGHCALGRTNGADTAISIGALERFVTDYVRKYPLPKSTTTIEHTGCKVAVIGAGPGGIACASALASRGHRVVIFEATHSPGGAVTHGVPTYRLPKDIVEYEVRELLNYEDGQLVSLQLNTPIGICSSVPELLSNGFDSVFVGVGTDFPRRMNIPGEDSAGVYTAKDFLARINMQNYLDTPIVRARKIVVVGGGNVAFDCARCARRLGCDVTMIYRRTISRMPALKLEIEEAQEEDVHILTESNPVEVVPKADGSGIVGVRYVAMKNTYEGACTPIAGTEKFIEADLFVVAIGNEVNKIIMNRWPELETDSRGCITVDENHMTNIDGVFAAGDVVTGAATVVKALGAGKAAGLAMDKWLIANNKGDLTLKGAPVVHGLPLRDINAPAMQEVRHKHRPTVVNPLKDSSTYPITIDISDCCHCGTCVTACANQSVEALKWSSSMTPELAGGAVRLADTNCIGCGQCASACPVGAIRATPALGLCLEKMEHEYAAKVAVIAPSCKVGFFEGLHGYPGNGEAEMIAVLRNLGFTHVYDVQAAADLTIVEEVGEVVERITAGNTPVLTSCCPGWVNMITNEYKELLPKVSTARSPQAMTCAIVRKGLSAQLGCKPSELFVTSFMPCTAKKGEIHKPALEGECDAVVTTRELVDHVKTHFVSVENRKTVFDDMMSEATGGAVIFGATGGVMEAALRMVAHLKGVDWTGLNFTEVRGLEGVKETEVTIGDLTLVLAVAHGGASTRAVLEAIRSGKRQYSFVESMSCPGGCLGGGGQPKALTKQRIAERIKVLRSIDTEKPALSSDQNSQVWKLYEDVIQGDAHKMLHMHHV